MKLSGFCFFHRRYCCSDRFGLTTRRSGAKTDLHFLKAKEFDKALKIKRLLIKALEELDLKVSFGKNVNPFFWRSRAQITLSALAK